MKTMKKPFSLALFVGVRKWKKASRKDLDVAKIVKMQKLLDVSIMTAPKGGVCTEVY